MFKSILVPLDGSKAAEAALTFAMRLSPAEVVLLRVAAPLDILDLAELGLRSEAHIDRLLREADEYLVGVETRILTGVGSSRRLTAYRDPAAAILEACANEGCDAIVMTTHGRTGLKRALVGSVAEHVVRSAPCPVLLVNKDVAAHAPLQTELAYREGL